MIRYLAAWLYAYGIAATLGGAIVWLSSIPDIPDEDDLIWHRGHVTGVMLADLFNSAVYLRFRDEERFYEYPSINPRYIEVRDHVGIYREVEILVEKKPMFSARNMVRIWGLIEHDPHAAGTVVTFDEIREEVTETERSWQGVALIFLAGGIAAILIGYVIRRTVPHVPKEPTA